MLRWLKTVVVSDEEKVHVMCQVGAGKTIIVEASKLQKMTSKPGRWCVFRDELGGCPLIGQAVSGAEVA